MSKIYVSLLLLELNGDHRRVMIATFFQSYD